MSQHVTEPYLGQIKWQQSKTYQALGSPGLLLMMLLQEGCNVQVDVRCQLHSSWHKSAGNAQPSKLEHMTSEIGSFCCQMQMLQAH